MIAIQSIETWWTKDSRGAPGAAARAASPDALALAQAGDETAEVLVHRVVRDERRDFEPRSSVAALSFQQALREARGLVLHAGLDALDVMFTWSPYTVGAPARRNGQAIRLRAGDWCRILHNGRMEEDQEWCYQETILNIAFRPATPGVFLDAAPRTVDDHRGSLW